MVLDVPSLVRGQIFGRLATLTFTSINLLRNGNVVPWHRSLINTWRRYLEWICLVVPVMDALISPV